MLNYVLCMIKNQMYKITVEPNMFRLFQCGVRTFSGYFPPLQLKTDCMWCPFIFARVKVRCQVAASRWRCLCVPLFSVVITAVKAGTCVSVMK